MKEKISLIGRHIRNSKVFYAVKANPDVGILRLLNDFNLRFEIASEGELEMLASVGVEPSRIISSNPVKSFKFLRFAASYGVNRFAFDSKGEIDKLAGIVPHCDVYIRLSVPNKGSEWPLSKKFGVELDDALSLLCAAKDKGLNPVGVTFHVGSQCTNLYNWNIALDKAKTLWNAAEKKGMHLGLLNTGGGYPINYTKSVIGIEAIEKNVDSLIYERFPEGTEIHIEPARAVVGDAGIFVTSVIGKARREYTDWIYIDVGVFNGLMESVGGIKYSYIPENRGQTGRKKQWTIAGPSCDSFDVIDKNVTREVLKYRSVEKVFFVEIDEEVINISKRFFPAVSSGVDDPRVEIRVMDGAEFVAKRKLSDIDAVIIDSTHIIGFARTLFTPDFFASVRDCLTDEGMFVTHTESLHFHKDIVIEIQETLRKIFPWLTSIPHQSQHIRATGGYSLLLQRACPRARCGMPLK